MIEVHPPHENVHTWRQFFIHIAAITIGLLMAIGLEQTVVYFHDRHQLQEARRELADELESNRRVVGINLEATRKITAELDANMALLPIFGISSVLPRHPALAYLFLVRW